jgi:hypothetical protein
MGLLDGFADELPGAKKVGAQQTIRCQDGSTHGCTGGTRGCYDNSPLLCGGGRMERHACADGTPFWCPGGTRDCFDDSPAHCPQGDRPGHGPGGWEKHTCADGTPFWCHGGTRECTDNSAAHCPSSACEPGTLALCVDGAYRPLRDLYRSDRQPSWLTWGAQAPR